MIRKFLLGVFLGGVIIATGCTFNNSKKEMVGSDIVKDKTIVNEIKKEGYKFNLSDSEINEAINDGKNNYKNINEYLDKYYRIVPSNAKDDTLAEVRLVTPYHFIMSDTAFKRSMSKNEDFFEAGKELHFKNAKDYLNHCSSSESILLKIRLYGNNPDCHKFTTMYFVQNERSIPLVVIGLENQAREALDKSNLPLYYKDVKVMASCKDGKIDFWREAQLHIIDDNKKEMVFDIVFSEYK